MVPSLGESMFSSADRMDTNWFGRMKFHPFTS